MSCLFDINYVRVTKMLFGGTILKTFHGDGLQHSGAFLADNWCRALAQVWHRAGGQVAVTPAVAVLVITSVSVSAWSLTTH